MKSQKTTRQLRNIVKRFLAGSFLFLFAGTWIIGMFIPETANIAMKLSPLIPLMIPIVVYYFKEN